MLCYLKSRLRRSPVREHRMLGRASLDERVSSVQFASFLQQSGFRRRALNRHDKTKRIKRAIAFVAIWSFVTACGWVAYESAAALSML